MTTTSVPHTTPYWCWCQSLWVLLTQGFRSAAVLVWQLHPCTLERLRMYYSFAQTSLSSSSANHSCFNTSETSTQPTAVQVSPRQNALWLSPTVFWPPAVPTLTLNSCLQVWNQDIWAWKQQEAPFLYNIHLQKKTKKIISKLQSPKPQQSTTAQPCCTHRTGSHQNNWVKQFYRHWQLWRHCASPVGACDDLTTRRSKLLFIFHGFQIWSVEQSHGGNGRTWFVRQP